ncbi:MAG: hypothetical protein ACR9NN_07415 [Nostochopsis sp.]
MSPFLDLGWNVFQYKQRDVFTSGRDKVVNDLKNGLKRAVYDLYDRTKKRPNKYVLFTNVNLTHKTNAQGGAEAQKGEIKKKILEDYDRPDTVSVEIVDAAGIASLLNDLPHLRSGFFSTDSFATWEKARSDLEKVKLYGANTILIGRDRELEYLRNVIDNPEIRAVVISGQHNIGKTRLVLEATNQRPVETVIALDPRSMTVRDLLALNSSMLEIIVVIEDPDLDKVENFIDQTIASQKLKLVITLPTVDNHPIHHNFGLDERIHHIQIPRLSEDNSRELLRAAKANFDYSVESWVIRQAGGNPGILLQSVGVDFRKKPDNFISTITDNLKLKIRQQFGENTIEVIQILSLLTYVIFKDKPSEEIKLICQWFGENIQPNKVIEVIERLEKSGEKLLTLPYDIKCWNPIDLYGHREFWNVLYKADNKRAVQIILCSGVKDIQKSYRLTYDITAIINQENDLDLLIEFAFKNENQAQFFCSILSAVKPNFWFISFKLLAKYPENIEIRYMLSDIAFNDYWRAENLHLLREKLEQLLDDDSTPFTASLWVEELLNSVNVKIEKELDSNSNNYS